MILVTGSLAFDYIMNFPGKFVDHILPDKIHILNLSFLLETLRKEKGGTAGNISYNLGLLKTNVSVLATAGEDFKDYGIFLEKSGVDISSIAIAKKESTATAFIITDQNDNQITGFYPGAMSLDKSLKISEIKNRPELVVISPTDPLAMDNFVAECQRFQVPYLFDPGMQLPRLTNEQLLKGIEGAKILITNDYEMNLIKDRLQLTDDQILSLVEIMITTLGEKGSEIKTKTQKLKIKPAKPSKISDPTGAGDAYRAGFLAGYIRGFNLQTCGQMGAVAACYTVEKYGTTTHAFTLFEFCKRYKENFAKDLKLQ